MIEILDPGPLTTVQDLGRFGFLRFGIPPSGPMDRDAFVAANLLVGNSHSMAALECTLIGPRFRAHAQCAIAVTGAEMPVTMNAEPASRRTVLALQPGDVVRIGPARTGVRGYIAFRGGIDVPLVMRTGFAGKACPCTTFGNTHESVTASSAVILRALCFIG